MRILLAIFVSTLIACGDGEKDGAACGPVIATGDQSIASCSTGGDVSSEQNINEETGIDGLSERCESLCISRGNPPAEAKSGDCFQECVDGALMGTSEISE